MCQLNQWVNGIQKNLLSQVLFHASAFFGGCIKRVTQVLSRENETAAGYCISYMKKSAKLAGCVG